MLYFKKGSKDSVISDMEMEAGLTAALDKLGKRKKILALPPDDTRFHSRAGDLTRFAWKYYGKSMTDIMPAIGTHFPMKQPQLREMFGDIPLDLFRVHDWRNKIATLGEVPADFVKKVSENSVDYSWPAQVNELLVKGGFDLILSIGQVVPHEVIGMASYNKNILVGTGGADAINKSHFLGAAYGMERIMGRADTPVRRVLNYASDHFLNKLPIVYVLTVIGRDASGKLVTRGLFIGDDIECFNLAAELSLKVNFEMLDKPLQKVVVYLTPTEFKSTWLGNKAVYRSRMVIADGGELIILAPGLKQFGEDPEIDRLIRKYGYVGTPAVMDAVKKNEELRKNLSAAAHLIHGSSESRFTITYCPGSVTRKEIEGVNFKYAELDKMSAKYDPKKLRDGENIMPDGENIFFISNPALGLWASRDRF